MTKEQKIVRAYVNFAGTTRYSDKKLASFLSQFPEVSQEMSRAHLRHIIAQDAAQFRDDIDPMMDIKKIGAVLEGSKTAEIDYFLSHAPNRMTKFLDYYRGFPFVQAESKPLIRKAVMVAYGQEPLDPGADADSALDDALTDVTGPEMPDDPMDPVGAPDIPEEEPSSPGLDTPATGTPAGTIEGPVPGEELDSLPPDIEEKTVNTMNEYLQKDVFNNKLVPVVKIVDAWQTQKGYVVKIELSSLDGSTSANTVGVIYNDDLVLPAELRDDSDQVIGPFDKETILNIFQETEGALPKSTENYQSLMDQMVEEPTVEQASKHLEVILHRFGKHVAKQALDTYVRVKHNTAAHPKFSAADRIEVRLGKDVPETSTASDYDDEEYIPKITRKEDK